MCFEMPLYANMKFLFWQLFKRKKTSISFLTSINAEFHLGFDKIAKNDSTATLSQRTAFWQSKPRSILLPFRNK